MVKRLAEEWECKVVAEDGLGHLDHHEDFSFALNQVG